MNPQSDCTPTKKALYQWQKRANTIVRGLEQSSDNVRRCNAHTNQAAREHESEQRAATREELGVREHESEQ